jgi:hypothetical protein
VYCKKTKRNIPGTCSHDFREMMPISFCNSKGFKEFMNVLQPGYRYPCPQTIIKRLELIYNEKRIKIEQDLCKVSCIAMTDDGWSSRSQDSYSSATAYFVTEKWVIKNYTLCTQLMEDRHTTENLKIIFNMINEDWNISGKQLLQCMIMRPM